MPPSESESAPARRTGFRGWSRWGRWSTYAAVVVVLALVAAALAGVVVVRDSFPQTSGEIEVPGLDSEVTVLRDAAGIPHVYAASSRDLFYAQGYVQAQDRFFEMDVRRHTTAGRLSEMFGESTLDIDKAVRTMGWRRVAEQEVSTLKPETQAYLSAFSDGVNAYIGDHSPSEMSLEYTLLAVSGLDYQVEDWTPADSVAWLKAMAWDLRGNMEEETQRGLLSASLGPDEIAEMFPPYPFERNRPIVPGGAVVDGRFDQEATSGREPARPPLGPDARRALERAQAAVDAVPALVGSHDLDGVGSNSWVVDGEHSETGKPILANDPHLGPSLPGIWYQMGLHCTEVDDDCPFDVTGFTFSGLPGVVIGHNQQVAWGFTNLGPDVVDLYLEKISGKTSLYDGRRVPLRTREEEIEVLGRDQPFRFTVRSTRHGPLLSDVDATLSSVGANASGGVEAPERDTGYAVALSWTALTPSTTADAIFAFDRASTWQEFRAAARDFAVPSQNMLYADRDGNIGYQAPGLIPVRRGGREGIYPARGWEPADDWTGRFVPYDAMPSVLNPDEGFIATANQSVTGPGYPYYLGQDWAYGYRSERINRMLERQLRDDGKVGVADMTAMQLDTRNTFAPVLVRRLLDIFMPSQYLASGQRLLQGWDFRQDPDSAAAAYFNVVWKNVLALTFRDQLRELSWPDGSSRWQESVRRLLDEPNSAWWDDVTTDGVIETRDDILQRAMANARDELVLRQDRRAVDWTWGHQHRLHLESSTLGQSDIPVVRQIFNRGGFEVGGGGEIVVATKWDARVDGPDAYAVTAAPSMRMVVSLADLDDSRWVNLTGVSGHAFHEHYTDQTELYLEGETLPWPSSRRRVEESATDRLTLVPREDG